MQKHDLSQFGSTNITPVFSVGHVAILAAIRHIAPARFKHPVTALEAAEKLAAGSYLPHGLNTIALVLDQTAIYYGVEKTDLHLATMAKLDEQRSLKLTAPTDEFRLIHVNLMTLISGVARANVETVDELKIEIAATEAQVYALIAGYMDVPLDGIDPLIAVLRSVETDTKIQCPEIEQAILALLAQAEIKDGHFDDVDYDSLKTPAAVIDQAKANGSGVHPVAAE